jgi:4-amino-4-deoxy-L-arabinose transferase-like glycosyltransferase
MKNHNDKYQIIKNISPRKFKFISIIFPIIFPIIGVQTGTQFGFIEAVIGVVIGSLLVYPWAAFLIYKRWD